MIAWEMYRSSNIGLGTVCKTVRLFRCFSHARNGVREEETLRPCRSFPLSRNSSPRWLFTIQVSGNLCSWIDQEVVKVPERAGNKRIKPVFGYPCETLGWFNFLQLQNNQLCLAHQTGRKTWGAKLDYSTNLSLWASRLTELRNIARRSNVPTPTWLVCTC